MKWNLLTICLFIFCSLSAQDNKQYPTPEFQNEIYYLDKNNNSLVRLEKGNSGIKSKMRMGGFGGSENSFVMDNEKSPVQIKDSLSLSFICYTGDSQSGGWDSMFDPSRTTSLYNAYPDQGTRKVVVQSASGMRILGKTKESKKYTFSVRKIRPGYLELVIDKPLPKGEYMFVVMGGFNVNMEGSASLFAFEIE
ncbi:MAG: hypothetical protein Q8868_05055 [Bacteroidota bacterium]|nr:hypothetical protein [Bacteroidota bacterium]